jgi:hypothetical protein
LNSRIRLELDDASLRYHLDELVRTKPVSQTLSGNPSEENLEWIGRARALIASWDVVRGVAFNIDCDNVVKQDLYNPMGPVNAQTRILHNIRGS